MAPTAFMSGLILFGRGLGPILVQIPFSIVGVILCWRAFRSKASPDIKAAALFVATFLASPQGFNYDLIPLAAAALVILRTGSGSNDRMAALLLWLMPVAVMAFNLGHVPVMPLLMAFAGWRLDRLVRGPSGADAVALRPQELT